MESQMTRSCIRKARWGAVVLFGLLGLISVPKTAHAHDPLFLEDRHDEPENGPLLPDARISFAVYGTLHEPQDHRGFQFRIPSGARLEISLLVPDLAPESQLAQEFLPSLAVTRPDQSVLVLEPSIRTTFAEPYSRTNYLRLLEYSEIGSDGTYQIRITGARPSRFTVSIGYIESFGTPVLNMANRKASTPALAEWYATPPKADQIFVEQSVQGQQEEVVETSPSPTTPSTTGTRTPVESKDLQTNPFILGGLIALSVLALMTLIQLWRNHRPQDDQVNEISAKRFQQPPDRSPE